MFASIAAAFAARRRRRHRPCQHAYEKSFAAVVEDWHGDGHEDSRADEIAVHPSLRDAKAIFDSRFYQQRIEKWRRISRVTKN